MFSDNENLEPNNIHANPHKAFNTNDLPVKCKDTFVLNCISFPVIYLFACLSVCLFGLSPNVLNNTSRI